MIKTVASSLCMLAIFVAGCAVETQPDPPAPSGETKSNEGTDTKPNVSVDVDGITAQSCIANCLGKSYHTDSLVRWCCYVCAQQPEPSR